MPKVSKWNAGHVKCQQAVDDLKSDLTKEIEHWQAKYDTAVQTAWQREQSKNQEIERLQEAWETADSVAQMAARDRDEALESFARVEQEYERLQTAARSILWMAEQYAEGGGRGGPEMRDYEAAAEIIGED